MLWYFRYAIKYTCPLTCSCLSEACQLNYMNFIMYLVSHILFLVDFHLHKTQYFAFPLILVYCISLLFYKWNDFFAFVGRQAINGTHSISIKALQCKSYSVNNYLYINLFPCLDITPSILISWQCERNRKHSIIENTDFAMRCFIFKRQKNANIFTEKLWQHVWRAPMFVLI